MSRDRRTPEERIADSLERIEELLERVVEQLDAVFVRIPKTEHGRSAEASDRVPSERGEPSRANSVSHDGEDREPARSGQVGREGATE